MKAFAITLPFALALTMAGTVDAAPLSGVNQAKQDVSAVQWAKKCFVPGKKKPVKCPD